MRLDKFVSDGAAMTRSESRKAIKTGRITVDGKTVNDGVFSLWNGQEPLKFEPARFNVM